MDKTVRTASVIIDSLSIKPPETVSEATRGWDGGKMFNGRKRHVIRTIAGTPALP